MPLATRFTRFEFLKRDARISYLEAIAETRADTSALRAKLEANLAELEEECAFIETSNIGGEFMVDEDIARIERIGKRHWRNAPGEVSDLLSEEEIYNLTIRRGRLTTEERDIINNHMAVTIKCWNSCRFRRTWSAYRK